ncbi:predicted protein [Methanosarcina acetivorans C2A]|uniref:Uncharacterized protein n=1 Tax=Methanosarcina acetivorans (strain ATCC 35395 / DSM 2834 / JCM 12185 / C2A) TaxID=188937 RepID=Q8TI70_METAC|nr:predicted protein [Methanosarcina acetivorans C2A]
MKCYHYLLGHRNFLQLSSSKPADPRILKIRENKKQNNKIQSFPAFFKGPKILKPKKFPARENRLSNIRGSGHFRAGRLKPYEK